jgi:hypothetical protein
MSKDGIASAMADPTAAVAIQTAEAGYETRL